MLASSTSSFAPQRPAGERAPLRIGLLVGSVAAEAGGVGEAIRGLAPALLAGGAATTVFSLAQTGLAMPGPVWDGIPVHLSPARGPRGFGFAPGLDAAVSAADLDVLHVHGLWMYLSVVATRWSARTGRPIVVSPHGMLDPWALANSRWKKRLAARLYEDAHLRRAAAIHALCEPEYESVRHYGLTNPACIVPNGVRPVGARPEPPQWRLRLPPSARVALFLGRLHPKKGLHELLPAWSAAVAAAGPVAADWHLVVAGDGAADYVRDLAETARRVPAGETIHLVGPQYGDDKLATLWASDAFVLPSVSEGQPLAVLEAWAHGLAALLTAHCNLPEGFEKGAALPIGIDRAAIVPGLVRLFRMSDEDRRQVGAAGQRLVNERFSWAPAGQAMLQVYEWLAGRGPRPDAVRMTDPARPGNAR